MWEWEWRLFHRETREILGIHCFGDQAAEIVHIGQAIMNQEGEANSLNYFINTTFNYPTMAEANKFAAGEWKKAHKPEGVLRWVERFHDWRR